MTCQRVDFQAIVRVPNADAPIAIRARQPFTIWTESHRRHPICVFLHLMEKRSILRGKHFHHLAGAAKRDSALVGADVRAERGIEFLPRTYTDDAFAGRHIEEHYASRLR